MNWLSIDLSAAEQITATPSASTVVKSFRHDAALHDVCFVSPTAGWAVGDRGVIWHTRDGGAKWAQQESSVTCSLNSVFFIDGRHGWAVGGESAAASQSTRGSVLRTADGGNTWTSVQNLVLPILNRVQFFNSKQGIAFGQNTSFHPSGVFATLDGGNTWQALPSDQTGSWLAGDFLNPESGAVAGQGGQLATLARRQIIHSPLAAPSLRSIHAMRLSAPTGGWAVGDGGLVMITNDLGRSWQTPPAELPEIVTEHYDFRAVAQLGSHVWIAGSPGTQIFHSGDGGQNWQVATTGQITPIRALAFIDELHGWAVGDLGNVLATSDGGSTWQVQRWGGKRAALLTIVASASDAPIELLSKLGAGEGYIAAVDILHTAAEANAPAQTAANQRASEALLLAGAASAGVAWRFPLPSADLALTPSQVLESLNRENDGRAVEQLQRHLVRVLRMWRPDLVVVQDSAGVDRILKESLKAIEAAADPNQHGELATELGLPPWQVKKVYAVSPAGSHGDESLTTDEFSPWLGKSLSDFALPARRLLVANHSVAPDTISLKQLVDRTPTTVNHGRGIFGGITIAYGSDSRRPQPELPSNDLDALRRLAARRQHLQKLLERAEGNAAWAGQVTNLIEGLSADDGGGLLVQLADGYREHGRLDLAADTYFLLTRRYPEHAFVDRALTWLVQFYGSSEAAHRSQSSHLYNVRQAALNRNDAPDDAVTDEASNAKQAVVNSPIGSHAAPAIGIARDDRLRRCVQLVEYLKIAKPALYAEPAVRFAEVAAQRELGFANPAKLYYLSLRQFPKDDPWRECAETQEWLATPGDVPPPKSLGSCRPTTSERPQLDGRLDEAMWQTTDHLRLRGEDDVDQILAPIKGAEAADKEARPANAAEVRLAYDKEFLYVAIQCAKAPAGDYRPDVKPRPRDSELTQHDRVSIAVDVDRDFSTAFELVVDHRGWMRESCCGDASWNPAWYVAAADDAETWSVEAAIPLKELVAEPPAARHVWAVAVRRTIPRVGYQSWCGKPASTETPDRFGMLIFE